MATHCMNREIIVKATECKPCTAIGKNLKIAIPAKQFKPHISCVEPNQDLQLDFGGPIFDEKVNELYFLATKNQFSKYLIACIYEKAK